jgi:hypothetical protein
MCKPLLLQPSYNGVYPSWVYETSCQIVSTCDNFVARDFDKVDYLNVSRFESYCSTCWDVQPFSIGFNTVEAKLRICFDKMIVRSNLNVMLRIERN